MNAILLAAGKGSRLGHITQKVPKPLLPINGRPLLEHTILLFKRNGVDQFFINLHHIPQAIMDHFSDGSRWRVSISYSYEKKLLGTAGAVKKIMKSEEWKVGRKAEAFWVVYGDNYFDCDLSPLLTLHQGKKGIGVIGLHWRDDVLSSGIVDLDDEGRIHRLLEKPKPEEVFSHLVNAGIFLLAPEILQFIPDGFSDFFYDVFPKVINSGERLYGYILHGMIMGIDTSEAYSKLQKMFANRESGIK
jgi:NDP-sugar pyrophosphorylase family protein